MELRMFCQAFGLTLKQFVAALEKAIAKALRANMSETLLDR